MHSMTQKTYSPAILVVDDEIHVLLAFRELLEAWGYTILTAFSGTEALRILDTRDVDMVMSDQSMPGMDGLELLDHINQQHPEVPFVMITGQDSIDKAVIAMRRGAVDYLLKPCREIQLNDFQIWNCLKLTTKPSTLMLDGKMISGGHLPYRFIWS